MLRLLGAAAAVVVWLAGASPALADALAASQSRYSAPLWTWIAAIIVSAALGAVGLLIGAWFLRKRSRIDSPD